ncbi:MAG: hypothetical protein P4L62_02820 [Candidatus Pacebacteria bacterium]|nr:hypothetical protein [Candidatus Paceibacterota bacterium]MDR3583266.1 hypothetical protein [Candidatus Paceibacterota bacterium]
MFTKHFIKMSAENIKNLKGTTRAILKYALSQDIEVYQVFPDKRILILKKDDKNVWLDTSLTSKTNPVGMRIARNKQLAKKFLKELGYPVPPSKTISGPENVDYVIKELSFPLVAKPLSAAEGKGITININDKDLLLDSIQSALKFDDKVIIEKHILGDYYRITYVADGSYAVMKNLPAFVSGNGKNTIKELITMENATNKERRPGGKLKKIKISGKTERFLASAGYEMESILPKSESIPLCFSGFDGGEYIDATKEVHPYFLEMSREISKSLGLPIVGIDIISRDIAIDPNENGGVVIEINGTYPDILFHSNPTHGIAAHLVPNLINYLFS